MTPDDGGTLLRLSDTGHTVADPTEDIRGRTVLDEDGARLGTVEDLLVDPDRRRIRFLHVVRGGVLGWGAKPCYVPADAVIRAGATVLVRTSGKRAPAGGGYGPHLAPEPGGDVMAYAHLAYAPHWAASYVPPSRWRRPPTR